MKETLALSNSICQTLGIAPQLDLGSNLVSRQVYLANDGLFDQSTAVSEVTNYAIGYADPNRNQLMALLDFLAPRRPGARKRTVSIYDETEPFEVVEYQKAVRASQGDFHTVKQRSLTKVEIKIVNVGLSIVLDEDDLIDMPNWEQVHTMYLMDLLTRAAILKAISIYGAFALTSDIVWAPGQNPDMDIKSTNVQVLAPVTGFTANRMLVGQDATLLRQQAYEQTANAVGFAKAGMLTDEQIAVSTGLDRVRTNAERYNNNGTKSTFLGSKALIYTAQDSMSMEDASNLVRCTSATNGGGDYQVYVRPVGKKRIVTVEKYEKFHTQHTSGAALLNITRN